MAQLLSMVDNIICIPLKFNSQMIKIVAFMYISGKQVSGNSGGQNDNSRCICDKMYIRHAQGEQWSVVVDGTWCIPLKFNHQKIKPIASMFKRASSNQVLGKDNEQKR